MIYGGARGMKNFVVTLGTGLGSSSDGKLVYGHDGFAVRGMGHASAPQTVNADAEEKDASDVRFGPF